MIALVDKPIDRQALLSQFADRESGAVVTFEGVVRGVSRGRSVERLFYEAFPEMAVREMEQIAAEARRKWPLYRLAMIHRTGWLDVGEASVLIAVASAHRKEAFEACRFLIDSVKARVPIWKREHYQDGAVWVEEHP